MKRNVIIVMILAVAVLAAIAIVSILAQTPMPI